jgi:hypothetical protein
MRVLAALLLTVQVGMTSPRSATSNACTVTDFGAALYCGGSFVVQPPAPASAPHPKLATGTAPPPTVVISVLAQGPNGFCSVPTAVPAASLPSTPGLAMQALLGVMNLPACPTAAPAAGTPAASTPAALAVQYWRTIPLPVPDPSVPPGYAIAGQPAYLVTGGTVSPPPYRFATPLGPLVITASGSYSVGWGDGNPPGLQGPFAFDGEPYPVGRIIHTYDDVGTYRVTVVEHWVAQWSLAGATGTLDGLTTTATIPALAVRQLQSVIDY